MVPALFVAGLQVVLLLYLPSQFSGSLSFFPGKVIGTDCPVVDVGILVDRELPPSKFREMKTVSVPLSLTGAVLQEVGEAQVRLRVEREIRKFV